MAKTAMVAAGTTPETMKWARFSDVMLGNSFNNNFQKVPSEWWQSSREIFPFAT
jgi:hypothetical protein